MSQQPSKYLNKSGITDTIYYPSFLRLYFVFDNRIFPVVIIEDTAKHIKNELKLL